jgi:predicted nucleic acid-binding protein
VTIFIDSGGWLSVLIESDFFHQPGKAYFQTMIEVGALVVTTDFVLDEVITRLRYDIGHAKAVDFLSLVDHATRGGELRVVRITEDLWKRAERIFLRYDAARLSFTDCTSFAWLREHPVDEVFGYDSHFEMMGHILQPKPR